jgi:hypothetical protein
VVRILYHRLDDEGLAVQRGLLGGHRYPLGGIGVTELVAHLGHSGGGSLG